MLSEIKLLRKWKSEREWYLRSRMQQVVMKNIFTKFVIVDSVLCLFFHFAIQLARKSSDFPIIALYLSLRASFFPFSSSLFSLFVTFVVFQPVTSLVVVPRPIAPLLLRLQRRRGAEQLLGEAN